MSSEKWTICGASVTTLIDPAIPAPGSGLYYMVRGSNACGIGTWGAGSGGLARISPACP